jgi:hypothetical protein
MSSAGVVSSCRGRLRSRAEASDGGFHVHCDRFKGTKKAQDGGVGGQCQVLASPMRRRPSRRWLSSGPGTLLAFLFHVLDTRQYRSNALASKPSVIHTESFEGTIWRWRARRQCEAGGVIAGERRGRRGVVGDFCQLHPRSAVSNSWMERHAVGLRGVETNWPRRVVGCRRRESSQIPNFSRS